MSQRAKFNSKVVAQVTAANRAVEAQASVLTSVSRPNVSQSNLVKVKFPKNLGTSVYGYWEDPTTKVEKYALMVPAIEFPRLAKELPRDNNPRPTKHKSALRGKIRETAAKAPEEAIFYTRNLGVTLIAKTVRELKDHIEIEFDISKLHGAANGLTTTTTLGEMVDIHPKQFVTLEVLVGVPEVQIRASVQGRNTVKQLKAVTAADYLGKHDALFAALAGTGMDRNIVRREGDAVDSSTRKIEPATVMSLLLMADPAMRTDNPPVGFHAAKNVTPYRVWEKDPTFLRRYSKETLKEVLSLYDHLHTIFQPRRSKTDMPWLYISRTDKETGEVTGISTYLPVFLEGEAENRISQGFMFPLFYAATSFLRLTDDDKVEWEIPFSQVLVLLEENRSRLLAALDIDVGPDNFAKNANNWRALKGVLHK